MHLQLLPFLHSFAHLQLAQHVVLCTLVFERQDRYIFVQEIAPFKNMYTVPCRLQAYVRLWALQYERSLKGQSVSSRLCVWLQQCSAAYS